MKQFISWIGKRVLSATVTAVFFVLAVFGIVYATISYPGTTPAGEVAGGKFAQYFSKLSTTGCAGAGVVQSISSDGTLNCIAVPAGAAGAQGIQ